MSFYVSTAIYFLLHCDEWDRFVAPPRHKYVTGATLLQLGGPAFIFKCGSRKEKYLGSPGNDIIESAKRSQISEKY